MTPTDEAVFARLRGLADDEAARTSPWPALELSIRRDRRRRALRRGAAAALAAALLGAALVPPARHGTADLAARVFRDEPPAGAVGGALGRDRAWTEALTAALRERLAADRRYRPQTLRLLWTDDLAGRRRAVASVQGQAGFSESPTGNVGILVDFAGPLGAGAGQLGQRDSQQGVIAAEPRSWVWPQEPGSPDREAGVLVICAGCQRPEWSGRPSYGADLQVRRTWHRLAPSGAGTWQGSVPGPQRPVDQLRSTGPFGPVTTRAADSIGLDPGAALRDVPAQRREAVTFAAGDLLFGRGLAWRDITAVRSAPARGAWFHGLVTALRTTSGAWLAVATPDADARTGGPAWSSPTVLMRPADPADLLVVLPVSDPSGDQARDTLAVLAPDGAVTVEANGRAVPVRDGAAVLDFPAGIPDRVRISATDAAGHRLGTLDWPLLDGPAGRML